MKNKMVYVIQGNYGYGWDDLTEHENRRDAIAELKVYRENEPQYAHRLIRRKESQ